MAVDITWLGHASFRIAGGGSVVYIDPWKLSKPVADADAVFVSHSHYDHCSSTDVARVSGDDTVIVAPAETIAKLRPGLSLRRGQTVTVGKLTFEGVAAYNVEKRFHPKTNAWLGVVVGIDGRRIYYAGDTDVITEMARLTDIDLALLPVGGTYTMNAAEAAEACGAIGCRAALPYHWGDIIGAAADAQALAEAAPCPVHVLQPRQTFSLDEGS